MSAAGGGPQGPNPWQHRPSGHGRPTQHRPLPPPGPRNGPHNGVQHGPRPGFPYGPPTRLQDGSQPARPEDEQTIQYRPGDQVGPSRTARLVRWYRDRTKATPILWMTAFWSFSVIFFGHDHLDAVSIVLTILGFFALAVVIALVVGRRGTGGSDGGGWSDGGH